MIIAKHANEADLFKTLDLYAAAVGQVSEERRQSEIRYHATKALIGPRFPAERVTAEQWFRVELTSGDPVEFFGLGGLFPRSRFDIAQRTHIKDLECGKEEDAAEKRKLEADLEAAHKQIVYLQGIIRAQSEARS